MEHGFSSNVTVSFQLQLLFHFWFVVERFNYEIKTKIIYIFHTRSNIIVDDYYSKQPYWFDDIPLNCQKALLNLCMEYIWTQSRYLRKKKFNEQLKLKFKWYYSIVYEFAFSPNLSTAIIHNIQFDTFFITSI